MTPHKTIIQITKLMRKYLPQTEKNYTMFFIYAVILMTLLVNILIIIS